MVCKVGYIPQPDLLDRLILMQEMMPKLLVFTYDGAQNNLKIHSRWRVCLNNIPPYLTTGYQILVTHLKVGGGNRFAEIFIFQKNLSDEDRQKFEGYLSHKWGMDNELSFEHPYRASPPPGLSTLKKANQVDDEWHHWGVSYGETPGALKLYFDGQLIDGPVSTIGSGTIPTHDEPPAIGDFQGTFPLDGFGKFHGLIDDLRIYDRGLSGNEIARVYTGDVNNTGAVEYRAIEKPLINTLSALDARPQSVILRAELTSIGGEVVESSSSSDLSFKKGTFPGMQAWYSAESIAVANGASVTSWEDQSGNGRDFENSEGSPRLLSFGLNGKPVVSFDGDDLLWTGHNFDTLTQNGYTILSLARYTGAKNQRIISSRTRNFLFGFHSSHTEVWYAEGWITNGGTLDTDWHLHLGIIEGNQGDPAASLWRNGELKVSESRGSSNLNFGPGVLQLGGWMTGSELSACEIAEIIIYQGQLNALQRAQLEGYIAHKWNLPNDVLQTNHPYSSSSPFEGETSSSIITSIGGDPAEVILFWGNEKIETNSTNVDPDDNSSWDYKLTLSSSSNIGTLEQLVTDNLEENTDYYYRAYAKNLAGENWAKDILTFRTIDTQFTKDTMDGLLLWLDASDIDGDGQRDSLIDQASIPLWLDKSRSGKHATQSIISKMPAYDTNGFGNMPAVDFKSGKSMLVGTLSNLAGPINVFVIAQGEGVAIGADDGISSWTLEARSGTRLNSFKGENDALQQITLGMDPRTGFGLLTGKISEVMVFDRLLESAEREMIEGYLAHKWGILDDLAQSGFSVSEGLVLYYPFNETGGSIVEDYSLDLRHAIVIDADLGKEGKFSSGLGLDGISSATAKVDLGANELLLNQLNWSISSWFLSPIYNPDDGVVSDYALTDADGLSYLYFDKTNNYQLFINGQNPPNPNFSANSLSGTSNSPDWHQITLTSSSNQFIVYVDGSEVTRYSGGSAGSLGIISLGNLSSNNGRFSPALDDFRVYNRTLYPSEVSKLYGNGDGDFGTHVYAESPPVFDNIPEIIVPKDALVHWEFNDLNGTVVLDSSGLGNHGVVETTDSNFDLFTSNIIDGKRESSALYFDDNLTIKLLGSEEVANSRSAFTIAFWINTEDRNADIVDSGRFQVSIADGYLNAQAYIGSRWKQIEPVLFPFGSWVHLILWWDGTKLKFFINNQESTNSINAKGSLSGDSGIYLGGRNELGSGSYSGTMEDFRFYEHALSPDQRERAYLGLKSSFVTSYGEEFSFQIDALRGPTDYNASGLPEGLQIDHSKGLIFGTPEQVGDFNVTLVASNSSGSDEDNVTLFVLPGEQSIISNDIGLLRYGDAPIDLNWTATSGLPVQIEILEGNESVDLNSSTMPCTLTILHPGFVKLLATQPGDGNSTFASATKIVTPLVVAKKELTVRVHNHYRKSIEDNPILSYQISGFVSDDNSSEFSQDINVSVSVSSGSSISPTPVGEYPILAANGLSEKYFFSYIQGTLTVSDKKQQDLIFDQNLTNIPALSPPISLLGFSVQSLTEVDELLVSGGNPATPFYEFNNSQGIIDIANHLFFRGKTYIFKDSGVNSSHPFMIGESWGETNSDLISGGPLNGNGGQINLTIPEDFNSTIYYFCSNHNTMIAPLTIADPDQNYTQTNLPLYYDIEDESVAQLIVTRDDSLKSYWKFDHSKYAEALDEKGRNSGTVLGMNTIGADNAWREGKFFNGLLLDGVDGRVDFGPLQLDKNFSFSFWVYPEANATIDGEMTLLSKTGITSMNHFRLFKMDGNGSIGLDFFADGNETPQRLISNSSILTDRTWNNFVLTFNASTGSLNLLANGEPVISASSLLATSGSIPYGFRFCNLVAGAQSSSFHGIIDDLRLYEVELDINEVRSIYNSGGGDFHTIKINGFGKTKINAFQQGNDIYEKAIPVANYLAVDRVPQTISFNELQDRSVGDFPFLLEATSSSDLPVSFFLTDIALANLNQNLVTIRNAGELTVIASQEGNDRFLPAETVSQTFSIKFGNLFADSVPGLALWLDANDVNYDNVKDSYDDFLPGNLVSLWADRSGNNNSPVQAEHGNMPTWQENSLHGKAVISFYAPSDQFLELRQVISEPTMALLVLRTTENGESTILGGDLGLTSSSGQFQFSYNNQNPIIQSARSSNTWAILAISMDIGSQNLWIDGDLIGSSTNSNLPSPLQSTGKQFSGEIAEILIFEDSVTFSSRQKVEGYLAHKWGLKAQLPSLHPFQSSPPAFGGNQFITWFGTDENTTSDFPRLPIKSFGDDDFLLNVEASSGLPVIFSSDDSTTVSIAGNNAKILSPGKVIITAYQNGNSKFFAADPQSVELEIVDFSDPLFEKDDQNVTFEEIPLKVREDPPFQINAHARSTGNRHYIYNLPVSFQVVSGPASIDARGVITLSGNAGTVVISASQSGNAFVNAAVPVLRTFEVSSKTRPSILFLDQKDDNSSLDPLLTNARPIFVPGVISSNGKLIRVNSSNPEIIEVLGNSKIVARQTGEVTLLFSLPEDDQFAQAVSRTRKISVVRPTKDAWLENRKKDPRYSSLKQKFVNRMTSKVSPLLNTESLNLQFDSNQADSDGDGYSNLFERALGMDSLGYDRKAVPSMPIRQDNRPSISFIRYSNPLQSTDEAFTYHIEQSYNLRTWTPAEVFLMSKIDQGGGLERVTYVSPTSDEGKKVKFLRLKISTP